MIARQYFRKHAVQSTLGLSIACTPQRKNTPLGVWDLPIFAWQTAEVCPRLCDLRTPCQETQRLARLPKLAEERGIREK